MRAFSDFEPKRRVNEVTGVEELHLEHHTKEEYVQYLQDYADHFGVSDYFKLRSKIVEVIPERTKDNREVYFIKVLALEDSREYIDGPFDHIAVCSGSFNVPKITGNKIPGFSSFNGQILHTSDF